MTLYDLTGLILAFLLGLGYGFVVGFNFKLILENEKNYDKYFQKKTKKKKTKKLHIIVQNVVEKIWIE